MSGAVSRADHLVHGMGTELEAPVWPAITEPEAEGVLAHFPQVGRVEALRWHSPRPFSAATLVEAGGETLFLKRHHRAVRSRAALGEEHAFMAHLRAKGLSVPDVMVTSDGGGAVAQGEWTYELHRRAPGIDLYRERQSWTPFLSHDHAFEAGVALARLHAASRDFAAEARDDRPLVASFTIVPSSDPLASAEAYLAARPALDAYLDGKSWRRELARLFDALGEGIVDRIKGRPTLWTHNDWHPSNLLWSVRGTVSAVIDFGLATRTCAIHDLATAIERTAIPWLEIGGNAGDPQAARALIAGYRTVLPLTGADVHTIARLLPLVHVEFALSEVDYFAGILADRGQADLAWQDYLIGHAEWFLSPPGRDFLSRLEDAA
nr:phosphotransferase [Sphingomonas sp. LH128]